MSLALNAFVQVAEQMMAWDVTRLVGPKNLTQADRDNFRWGSQTGYCVVGGQIASRCIESGYELLHNHRDFDPFARRLGLPVVAW